MSEETKYKEAPLWQHVEPVYLTPGGSLKLEIPSKIESAAKSFYFTQEIFLNGASEYQYAVKSSIELKVEYKNEKLEPETFYVLFNRDTETDTFGFFTNSSVLELQGNDIKSLSITLTNSHDTDLLTLKNLCLFESDDIQITTIAKVLKEETIAADLIQATSVFTDAIFTQILQTNAMSRSARLAQPGQLVDYIQAEGYELGFFSAELGSETEQFTISSTVAGTQREYVYWYSQIEGDDAFKYLTTIDPREKFPDISDSNREKFAFLVYKPVSVSKKMSIEFAEDENGNLVPTIIYGVGTDPSGLTNNGKAFTYKNSNGFYHVYNQSDGDIVGIVMDESGVHITGWADQHLETITFKDNGVRLKFTGEEGHSYEYVYDENSVLTGILQDSSYLTSISYESGVL